MSDCLAAAAGVILARMSARFLKSFLVVALIAAVSVFAGSCSSFDEQVLSTSPDPAAADAPPVPGAATPTPGDHDNGWY